MPADLRADEGWHAVDFISDLHLSATTPRTFDAWRAHMAKTPAQAVFILGDLFDVWIGDDTRWRPFERACVEVMAEASRHRRIHFMAGNRDFLLGADMLQACGLVPLMDPTLLDAHGRRLLLTHGDELCIADVDYQAFRRMVRGGAWQRNFLALPIEQRAALAQQIRAESQMRKDISPDTATWADVDPSTAVDWLREYAATEMIHGHTHRPGSGMLRPGFTRHVLSDWDLDASPPRAQVLRLDAAGLHRLPPDAAP